MLASRLRGSWDLVYARLRHPAQDGSRGSDQALRNYRIVLDEQDAH
jgi:hypothetical protein